MPEMAPAKVHLGKSFLGGLFPLVEAREGGRSSIPMDLRNQKGRPWLCRPERVM